jgi:DNA repair exonuclease SbcCD ATPase subunit
MSKVNVKGIEIPLHFHNYKLLKDKRFLLKGSAIYFIKGPNRAGKTSFLNALAAMQMADEKTPEPVTRGEQEGYNEFVIPGADGKMYTVRHTFDNDKNKFIAVDEDGNKISQVTKIREIFNYTHFTVDQFFQWSNDAKGRRKQRDIILELLPVVARDKFQLADDEETVAYEERTEVGRAKDYCEKAMKGAELSEEDQKKLKDLETTFADVEKVKEAALNVKKITAEIDQNLAFLERLGNEIAEVELKLKDLSAKYKNLDKEITTQKKAKAKLLDERTEAEVYDIANKAGDVYDDVTELKAKKGIYDKEAKTFAQYQTEWTELNSKIEKARAEKKEIISKSKLPLKSMSFDDGYLTIDGFRFDEKQVCESDGVILVAKIMAKINPAPIQLVGDASILDLDRLEELNAIAEAEGKIMFVDEVSRDINELQVVGYEQIRDKIEGEKELKEHLEKASKMTDDELRIDIAAGHIDENYISGSDPYDEPEEETPTTLF